jgi:hypothetical protein
MIVTTTRREQERVRQFELLRQVAQARLDYENDVENFGEDYQLTARLYTHYRELADRAGSYTLLGA